MPVFPGVTPVSYPELQGYAGDLHLLYKFFANYNEFELNQLPKVN